MRPGTPGDSERYPRINVIARREGDAPGPCVHFNSHIDVVQTGAGWTLDPFAAVDPATARSMGAAPAT